MAPHSSTFAWKIPRTEEPVDCSPWGREESDTTGQLHFHFSFSCIGEGNGNPLQCSCLENPRDGGAWWAAVYAVAQSPTRLKPLSSSSSSSKRIHQKSLHLIPCTTGNILIFNNCICQLRTSHLCDYPEVQERWDEGRISLLINKLSFYN